MLEAIIPKESDETYWGYGPRLMLIVGRTDLSGIRGVALDVAQGGTHTNNI